MIRAALARLWRGAEARAAGWPEPIPGATLGGGFVSPQVAESLPTLLACTNAIAANLAALPATVRRTTAAGIEFAPLHPVSRLLRAPNAYQTWPEWLEFTVADCLLSGTALSVVEYDGAGRAMALVPVPWRNVGPVLLPGGRLAFDVTLTGAPWGIPGQRRRLLPGEYFLLKDRGNDIHLGLSRLARAAATIRTAASMQTFHEAMYRNQLQPSGAVKLAGKPGPDVLERLRASLRMTHAGPDNAGRVLLLSDGAEWQSLSISPEDAETLATRRFTTEELARIYAVPPPIVGDLSHGTFTNSREAARWFAQFTLTPWVRKIEAAFSHYVFTDPAYSLELDLSGLLRGDAETRWQSHKIAVEANILTPNEVREIEGFNPRPDGEAPVA